MPVPKAKNSQNESAKFPVKAKPIFKPLRMPEPMAETPLKEDGNPNIPKRTHMPSGAPLRPLRIPKTVVTANKAPAKSKQANMPRKLKPIVKIENPKKVSPGAMGSHPQSAFKYRPKASFEK